MRLTVSRIAGGAFAIAVLAAATGCQTTPPQTSGTRRPPAVRTPPLPPPPMAGPQMFAGAAIDDLEDEEAVHYFARRADGALLVQVRGGRFLARATALDGTPKGDKATDVGAAPTGTAELVVGGLRAVGDGYVLTWAERQDGRTKIATLPLEATGAARGARANVTEISDEVSWVDVMPREGGALVLWETSQGSRYDVSAIALDAKGAAASPAAPLLTGVLGWHAAPGGGALAVVLPASTKAAADDGGMVQTGKVALVPLDASGKPKPAIEISAGATAEPDVVIAEVAGKWVLAWTDVREIDAAVWTAALDKTGAITAAAKRATPPTGEQALVAAVGAETGGGQVGRGLLAWEDVLNAPPESRQIHLATLGADGSIGKERATMAFHAAGTPPDLAVDATGFAAVTLAPAWQGGAPPEEAPVWPTFVRFGPDLSVLSAEPVRTAALGSDGVPYMVHGLSCRDASGCTTLASGGQAPPKVAVVSLASRKTEWYSPARRDPDDAPPRASALSALYSGEQIGRVAVTPLSTGGHLAAWVSYFPEGPPAERLKKSGEAELALVVAAPGAVGAPTPIQLSKKAVSVGGVAMAAAPGDAKEIAIAWVAREKGESQVYVTKVDETGKKLTQKKLTVMPRAKKAAVPSEASDVAIAWSSAEGAEGWVVSWVDTRDGNAEVYAARLDRALTKVGPDHRLTDAPGDAAEIHLLPRGNNLLVAWSDARNEPEEGRGDIYVARVEVKGLTKLGPETRLAGTPTHSRSPQLTVSPAGTVWASWIEDAGDNADAGGAVRFAVLDEKGAATTTTTLAGGPNRTIVSAAIACGDKTCRGVVAKSTGDALLLDGFTLSPAAQPLPGKTLLTLPGAGAVDISPMFADRAATSLFFGADAASGTGRVRHMKIDW